ncbi:zinc metalloprotease [Ahniella affigens]|uniref:Zinc metalloprotease n=2 Tax=Ahniella affigens TaxID=2021234 RepID=A0A2P1PRT2_9GAMM|nr:zinc metalloprotease [Ahniella affigens]
MPHHIQMAASSAEYRDRRRTIEVQSALIKTTGIAQVTTIPVVVHVLYSNAAENVSDAQIDSQIRALNENFRKRNADVASVPAPFAPYAADAMIEFVLANRDPGGNPTSGITRTAINGSYPYDGRDDQATITLDSLIKEAGSGMSAWPASSYLNLWVCPIQGGLLGYAQFPGGNASTDGVVINVTAFGVGGSAVSPYDLGRTAVHEVGHWLNLLHIWGDDRGGCLHSDNVADTPNQANANTGAPRYPNVSCNNGPDGDMFMNFMDYTDDAVMTMFTRDQVARMTATLLGPRASLALSKGYVPADGMPAPSNLLRALGIPVLPAARVFDGVDWV